MNTHTLRPVFRFVVILAAGIVGASLPAGRAQFSPINQDDPCAMFRLPGSPRLCLPVKIFVTDSHEVRHHEIYCDPPGILPCNEKRYVTKSIDFSYTAEASGTMLYDKDLTEFFVTVMGTAQRAQIKQISGYEQSYTMKGKARLWHKRPYSVGSPTIRNPVTFSIGYPAGEGSNWNVMFNPLEIALHDDYLPSMNGSQLGSEAVGQDPKPWMITPQEMRQIVAAGGFTRTFKWRDTQPNGLQYEDHNLTIRAEFGEPCREKIGISIRTADGQVRYCFSEGTPGKLELTLTADVTPAAYADDVTWTLPDLAGSTRAVSPANAKGRTIKVTYTNLPKSNSDFGPKTVRASVSHGKCQGQAEKELKFFFPALAKNNPAGTEPNWFYYWAQTSARTGPARFSGASDLCAIGSGSRDLGYYRNLAFDTVYYLCDLKALGPDFPFVAKGISGNKWSDVKVTGIDTFAVACLHENAHSTHFIQWWKAHQTADKFEDLNKNRIKDDAEAKLDKDGDLVPDSLENGLHLDPKNRNTYGIGPDGDDEEALCWFAEAAWKVGQADKEDWAKPGKQWK